MPKSEKPRRIAVLGGGPAGLSAAYRLLTSPTHPELPPIAVDVYEATRRFGGVVTTERADGFTFELGPASMQAKHSGVRDLIYEKLELGNRVLPRSGKTTRFYLLKNGELIMLPSSPVKFLKTRLLSWKGKLEIMSEVVRKKGNVEGETVGDFFKRRFGKELVDYVIDPMVAGIYASRPKDLGIKYALAKVWKLEREAGSVIRGMFTGKAKAPADARFNTHTPRQLGEGFSYDDGLDVLTGSLCEGIKRHNKGGNLNRKVSVRALDRNSDGTWRVNGKGKYDAVISTIPTHSLGSINSNVSSLESGFQILEKKVKYAAVSIVVLGFDKSQVSHPLDGFGALIPTVENRKILGINFGSSNFPSHAKDRDKVFLTCYLGGRRQPEIPFKPAQEVVDISMKELRDILGVTGQPSFSRVKTWYQGIPQYEPDHGEVLCTIARIEKRAPGLIFAGNYRDGVGLPDALMSGINSADRARDYLQTTM